MNRRLLSQAIMISLLVLGQPAQAGSFRCGTHIVITGDPVGRLLRACGKPSLQYKARESIRDEGQRVTLGVTHWVYERGRQKNMVVSVHGGKVVKIARE